MADVPIGKLDELNDLVCRVVLKVEARFGTAYSFEHGGLEGSKVSCGVDQAHLHIAPLRFDLIKAAQTTSPGNWNHVGVSMLPRGDFGNSEYWFVSSGKDAMVKAIDNTSSQFFRKIIAREAGTPEYWDYKSNDFIENVATTIRAMA